MGVNFIDFIAFVVVTDDDRYPHHPKTPQRTPPQSIQRRLGGIFDLRASESGMGLVERRR